MYSKEVGYFMLEKFTDPFKLENDATLEQITTENIFSTFLGTIRCSRAYFALKHCCIHLQRNMQTNSNAEKPPNLCRD